MSETTITYLILSAIACIASFLAGYFLCKSRGARLDSNSKLCDNLEAGITDSQDRIGDIIEAGNDIEAILRKYSTTATESKDLE